MSEERDKYISGTEKKLKYNKPLILAALKSLDIDTVTVRYEGAGDSGCVEDVVAKRGKDPVDIEDETVSVFQSYMVWKDGKTEEVESEKEATLEEALRDMTYDMLEVNEPGWELDEGSSGDFVIRVGEDRMTLEHSNNITYTEYRESEL